MSGSQSEYETHKIIRQSKPLPRDKTINRTRPVGDLDARPISVLKIARINMLVTLVR